MLPCFGDALGPLLLQESDMGVELAKAASLPLCLGCQGPDSGTPRGGSPFQDRPDRRWPCFRARHSPRAIIGTGAIRRYNEPAGSRRTSLATRSHLTAVPRESSYHGPLESGSSRHRIGPVERLRAFRRLRSACRPRDVPVRRRAVDGRRIPLPAASPAVGPLSTDRVRILVPIGAGIVPAGVRPPPSDTAQSA